MYVDAAHTIILADTADFPQDFKYLAQKEVQAFLELKERKDVLWTYLCPPADFRYEAPQSGKYKIGGIELPFNSKGESFISYKDYALALIDEIENKNFVQNIFSVVGE